MAHSTSPIGTDIQDGGYRLPRIPLPRTPVNNSGQLLWVASQRSTILGKKGRTSGDDTMDEKAGHGNRTAAWNSGDAYEPYVGRWSRLVAREFLGWLAVAPGGRWLDVGCGTGALAETILALAAHNFAGGSQREDGLGKRP